MGFSTKQAQALRRSLDGRHVRMREVNGRELSYIEGWYVMSEANRIFGFDGWNRETVESRCILARENRGSFLAVYIARVRITVHADGTAVIREGHGTGEGRGTSPGEVHDVALKAAETDATKRALATFGRRFGLELYRNRNAALSKAAPLSPPKTCDTAPRLGFHRDHTAPIQQNSFVQHLSEDNRCTDHVSADTQSLLPVAPASAPAQIDKSVLTIAEPRRLRDKSHLKYIATQPCLVCGRQPSDPHHLSFAQPRALNLKVSDEFTVPLCRGHHRQLHQVSNEIAWWEDLNIDALEIAKGLWEQTRPSSAPADTRVNAVGTSVSPENNADQNDQSLSPP
jgi:hypothetical protein